MNGKKIDIAYDDILGVNYELHAIRFSELKLWAKEWYKDFDLKAHDIRNDYLYEGKVRDEGNIVEMKLTGIVANYFYVYLEDGEYYLLDGYNRLFTEYANLDIDPIVYVRVIIDKSSDAKLMSIMFRLNMWKLNKHRIHRLETKDFFDRGFRLFMHKKFDIVLDNATDYKNRERNESDFTILDLYFRRESEMTHDYSYGFKDLIKLFSGEKIIDDLKECVIINDYMEPPFKNYRFFKNGYVMFLSWRRVEGDLTNYSFDDFLTLLKEDKFYKKLIKMSWTDSTRKNVYKFFTNYIKNKL